MASSTNKYFTFLLFLSVSIFLLGSCKTKKLFKKSADLVGLDSSQLDPRSFLIQKIDLNANDFSYYSCRGQAAYKDKDQSADLDVSIVMEKNRYIYMNATALLGIGVARILITPDSITILDLIHRKCIIANYSYLQKMTNVPMDLPRLQNMIIGNTIFDNDQSCIADTVLTYILLNNAISPSQVQTTYYQMSDLKVARSIIQEKITGREFRIEYAEPFPQNNNRFPSDININIRAEKNVECHFVLSNFVFEKKKEISFVIPKNFAITRY